MAGTLTDLTVAGKLAVRAVGRRLSSDIEGPPDLDDFVRRYMSRDWRGDGDMFKLGFDWVANRCEMLNIGMREWGHKHLYNEEALIRVARMAGLQPKGRCEFGKSDVRNQNSIGKKNADSILLQISLRTCGVSCNKHGSCTGRRSS